MCGDRRASLLGRDLGLRRRWGWQGVGVGTDFVSLTTLWRAYRRQRYRSWSSADAEGAFCVVCVQFLALCRRWAQQASLLGQVLDCRRRRECTQRCWSASVWQVGAVEEGLCGVVPPKDWQVGATEGTLWALPGFWRVGPCGFIHFFNHTPNQTARPLRTKMRRAGFAN